MRVYRRRAPEQRQCVHCAKPFESAHKRRIYCGNSCSTLAYYVRKARAAAASPSLSPAEAETLLAGTSPPRREQVAPSRLTLDWSKPNFLLLSAANFVTQVGTGVAKRLWDAFTGPSPSADPPLATGRPADPLDWLPAGLLSRAAPRVSLALPALGQVLVFVHLTYLGHTLFYQPTQRVLCIVPGSDGVFAGLAFRTDLWDKYSTAAPAQQRRYGARSNTARKAYKA